MLSPRFAKVMLERYKLEPKYGWGHETWVEELASEIEKMHFDSTWTSQQILDYVSKYVRLCNHQNPSNVNHERKFL